MPNQKRIKFNHDVIAIADSTSSQSVDINHLTLDEADIIKLAAALKISKSLLSLNLFNCDLKDAGAKILADALEANTVLQTFSLCYCNIGVVGANALALALKKNVTLQVLDLTGNSIDITGLMSFAEALRSNTTLQRISFLFDSLENLNISVLIKAFKGCRPSILSLKFSSLCKFEDFEIAALTKALATPVLQSLDLSLCVQFNTQCQPLLFKALMSNQSLKSILLRNLMIKDSVKELAEVIKTNTTLISINLGHNIVGDAGAITIAEVLTTNRSLLSLNLIDNAIGKEGARALSDALNRNFILQDLKLDKNKISVDLLKEINEKLERNRRNEVLRNAERHRMLAFLSAVKEVAAVYTKKPTSETASHTKDPISDPTSESSLHTLFKSGLYPKVLGYKILEYIAPLRKPLNEYDEKESKEEHDAEETVAPTDLAPVEATLEVKEQQDLPRIRITSIYERLFGHSAHHLFPDPIDADLPRAQHTWVEHRPHYWETETFETMLSEEFAMGEKEGVSVAKNTPFKSETSKALVISRTATKSPEDLKQSKDLVSRDIVSFCELIPILAQCKVPKDGEKLPDPELALRRAAAVGDIDIMKKLIELVKDLDINQAGRSGKTAMMYATEFNEKEAEAFLMKATADSDRIKPKASSEQRFL